MGIVRDRDAVSGLALAMLGCFVLMESRSWTFYGPDGPGPGFFPLCYGVLMIALSLALVVKAALRPDAGARDRVDWGGVVRALGTWALFAGTIALIEPLGFIASFGLMTLILVGIVFGKRWSTAIATAVGGAAGFWLVFQFALGLNLPTGFLWDHAAQLIGSR